MNDATVKLVVMFLGAIAVITVLGCFALAITGKDIPGALIGLGSSAVGAIAGILSNSGGGDSTSVAVKE